MKIEKLLAGGVHAAAIRERLSLSPTAYRRARAAARLVSKAVADG